MPITHAQPTSGLGSLNAASAEVRSGTRVDRRLALAALAACLVAGWMLAHPFMGIYHDSVLYSFQALARLHPQPLAHDIFLRFGSQDQYTVFSPLYAACIRLVGLETAAAILTFLAHVMFFCSAWLLARRFMKAELALLAVALLIVLPSGYGADLIFNYTEGFLTPRQPAEAFVLAGLAAALAHRRGWAVACIAMAMSLHPIMGVAGAALLLSQEVLLPRPKLAAATACLGLMLLAAIALLAPTGPLGRMDDTWLHIIHQRSSFLFILGWSAADWARTLLPLGVLAVGTVIAAERAIRLFCSAALITAAAGMLLSLIGGDLLRIIILIQAQTWRWLWVVNVAAVLLMPAIFRDCWKSNALARSTALLLTAAWVSRGQSVTLCSLLIGGAFVAALGARRGVSLKYETWVLRGAAGAVGVLLLASLADKLQLVSLSPNAFDDPLPIELQLARLWSEDGIVPGTIILGAWLAGSRWNTPIVHLSTLGAAVLACALLWPSTWSGWSAQKYSVLRQAYAPLRAKIPLDAEVLWPDASPVGIWYLLERQSYLSGAQTAGLVFSRAAATAMYRRAQQIGPILGRAQFEDWVPEQDTKLTLEQKLRSACRAPDLSYVVSGTNLGPIPIASYVPNASHPNVQERLYRCADLRVNP